MPVSSKQKARKHKEWHVKTRKLSFCVSVFLKLRGVLQYGEVVAEIVEMLDSDIDIKVPVLFTEAEAMEYDMTPAQERCLIAAGIIDNGDKPCKNTKEEKTT